MKEENYEDIKQRLRFERQINKELDKEEKLEKIKEEKKREEKMKNILKENMTKEDYREYMIKYYNMRRRHG